jgi:DNA-binding XRE family transcriptional regulator
MKIDAVKLSAARRRQGLTVDELARHVQFRTETIILMERQNLAARPCTVRRFAHALNVEPTDLLVTQGTRGGRALA